MSNRVIAGFCPMCGHDSLFVGSGGHVTCCRLTCPRPTAADEILGSRETEHVVTFTGDDFSVMHPLRERLDDELAKCDLHRYLASLYAAPMPPGRYIAKHDSRRDIWHGWIFQTMKD